MYQFIKYVLQELMNSLGLVFLACIAALAVLAFTYSVHKRKYKGVKKYPWRKAILWLIFAGYIAVVTYATILRGYGGYREWNLHLFRAWREAWNNFSVKNWANVLLNVAMFVPLGVLLPLLGMKFRKWYLTIPAAFSASLGIELLQLAIGGGICDVDDLFANTLGAAIGYFLIMTMLSLLGEKGRRLKPALIYGCLALMPVAAICSIFIMYELKEFGNLPMAAAYTNNIRGTEWTLDCDFPNTEERISIYQTQTMSRADCDALAEELASVAGQEVDLVSYYQDFAYYNLTGSILSVYYYDGSYEFGGYDHHITDWPAVDRETIENALKPFSVVIPEAAEFAVEEDGWYSFTCRQKIDGAVMMDGTLRCRYGVDDSIRWIENHLIWYTYYKDVPIITPEEAYKLLCAGQFCDGGYFEYKNPEHVRVFDCALAYSIDTKGFYQPVYYFDVVSEDGSYQDRIMIPAME